MNATRVKGPKDTPKDCTAILEIKGVTNTYGSLSELIKSFVLCVVVALVTCIQDTQAVIKVKQNKTTVDITIVVKYTETVRYNMEKN